MTGRLIFLAVVLVTIAFRVNGQTDCKGSVGTFNYDLSGLSTATGGAEQSVMDSGNTYFYRPCQAVSQAECKSVSPPDDTPAVCQKDSRKQAQFHDCGSTKGAIMSQRPGVGADQGFMLKFTGGEGGRLSDIEFICDKTQNPGSLQAKSPAEQPEHEYHLKWTTTFACPGGGDGDGDGGKGGDGDDGPAISGGWIFIIILLSLFVLYLIGGVAYNKFRKDAHGLELIPNHEFWFALPGLVKDGNVYTYRKLRGLCGAKYEEM